MVSAPMESTITLPDDFLGQVQVEPVGRWFLAYWDRLHAPRGTSTSGRNQDSDSESDSEQEENAVEFEDDLEYLRSLDPKDYKEQDHYKVLGLAKLRIKATDDQIKKAHRQKILKHHPDKRRAAGEEIREGDDYFTCITKAAEILTNPVKRRTFDSVDPTFDNDIPSEIKKGDNEDFFQTFAPVFERNARWSTRRPVPLMGDDSSPREKVDKFYKFWYDFESWREYSYQDEEDKDKGFGSDRIERRWIEKNNKAVRAEKKKEEMKRIRKLVDNAYKILKFKEDDRQEKMARKQAKADAAKARREEEERIRREAEEREKKEREEKEIEEKAKQVAAKKEKETQKKQLKKERKALRALCKDQEFFASTEEERVRNMRQLDVLCEALSVLDLENLNKSLVEDSDKAKSVFLNAVEGLNNKLERDNLKTMELARGSGSDKSSGGSTVAWSNDELSLLIKAVNLFPAGTNQRWEVVSTFIGQHSKTPEVKRTAKETLSKAKELQSGDFHLSTLKDEANKKAYENLEKQKKRDIKVESEASQRHDTAAEMQGLNVSPWTMDEQKLLEQALKTYPSSLGASRWEKIAECVPSRSKKDCMKRYKELAEIIRAKKAAQAATSAAQQKK